MNNIRIFIEGKDDQRFIDNILTPYILSFSKIRIFPISYAQKSFNNVDKNIQKVTANNQSYILLGDYDSSDDCITLKKQDLIKKYKHLDSDFIFIVKDEIESWFISGVDTNLKQFREFEIPDNTEEITKEIFNEMWENSHFDSKIDFMMEISKSFDFDLAVSRNNSFKYFIEKLNKILKSH